MDQQEKIIATETYMKQITRGMISTNLYKSSFFLFSNKTYRPFHIKTIHDLGHFAGINLDSIFDKKKCH